MAKKQIPDIDRGILSPKEKFCLNGYVYMLHQNSENIAQLQMNTYAFSRPTMPTGNKELVELRCNKWFEHPAVIRYINEVAPRTEKIVNNVEDITHGKEVSEEIEDDSMEQIYIQELEDMKAATSDTEERLKIIRLQHDIKHKSKDKFKEEDKTTRIYLPWQSRCFECPIYMAVAKDISEKTNINLKKITKLILDYVKRKIETLK